MGNLPTAYSDAGDSPTRGRGGLGFSAGVAFGIAAALTASIAWPVVVSPTRMIFGGEIVGRHYDPFLVIRQLAGAGVPGPYAQPLTDLTGWLLARVVDPVAAYNTLVLLSFPLSAATACALARYLGLGLGPSLVAGGAFAFAPLHLAHAAYHVHIAQTQWIPLYLLALCAMVDRPSAHRAVWLAAAAGALVLSNFYAGLLGLVITPVALVAYWWTSPRAGRRPSALWRPAAVLAAIGLIGLVIIGWRYPVLLSADSPFAFPPSDVGEYSARWWAYFVPPVDHAFLGNVARESFARGGVGRALLEQQVSVSYTLVTLALIASLVAARRWREEPQLRPILAFVAVALWAGVVSVGPVSPACSPGAVAPACWLHGVVPMFRSYARFAFLAHLGIALAAGAGVAMLVRRSRASAALAVACVLIAAFEYWPMPARARDVLPTQGHRWLAERAPDQTTLDCAPPSLHDTQVDWLMRRRLTFLSGMITTCRDPYLASKLAALGYTHVVSRQSHSRLAPVAIREAGLALLARFPDSRVYAVVADVPPVVTLRANGFYEFESAAQDFWQWMGPNGHWLVRNTTGRPLLVQLVAGLQSVGSPRTLEVSLDGAPLETLRVELANGVHRFGPWELAAGDHTLAFRTVEPPFRPSDHTPSHDDRLLTIAFRNVRWVGQPSAAAPASGVGSRGRSRTERHRHAG